MPAIRTCRNHGLRNGTEPAICRTIRIVGVAGIGDAWAAARTYLDRSRYRRELRRLLRVSPHMIEDIGLSREQARREAKKPFWQR